MESSTILTIAQLPPLYPSSPGSNTNKTYPFKPCRCKTTTANPRRQTRLNCYKMYVPGGLGGSPEAKASAHLHNFFTYIAVKIVAAQLESYNPEAHKELMEFLDTHSVNDGDEFCANLMRHSSRHKALAMRILEVRSAYCKDDFEWDNLKRLAIKMVNHSNTKLMREYVLETSKDEGEN